MWPAWLVSGSCLLESRRAIFRDRSVRVNGSRSRRHAWIRRGRVGFVTSIFRSWRNIVPFHVSNPRSCFADPPYSSQLPEQDHEEDRHDPHAGRRPRRRARLRPAGLVRRPRPRRRQPGQVRPGHHRHSRRAGRRHGHHLHRPRRLPLPPELRGRAGLLRPRRLRLHRHLGRTAVTGSAKAKSYGLSLVAIAPID